MARQTPLIHFIGVVPGKYMALWPVFIVGDDPANLSFTVAAEDRDISLGAVPAEDTAETSLRRRYVTTATRRRLHQHAFRQPVLRAYTERCTVCRLRHVELLEAAHILPDTHPRGEAVVPNGWRSASSTTPPSMLISSASGPTTRWTCGSMCWRRLTDRC